MTLELFAVMPVRDHAAARAWYERLLGEPAFEAHATETVWTLAGGRHIAVHEEPAVAGGGRVTMVVDDLDAAVAEVAARGLEPALVETYDNGVRKTTFRDPDGNEVGFGGAPLAGRDAPEDPAG